LIVFGFVMSFKNFIDFLFSRFDSKVLESLVNVFFWNKVSIIDIKLFKKSPKSSFIQNFCNFESCGNEFRVIDFSILSRIDLFNNFINFVIRDCDLLVVFQSLCKFLRIDESRFIFVYLLELDSHLIDFSWRKHFHKNIHSDLLKFRWFSVISHIYESVSIKNIVFSVIILNEFFALIKPRMLECFSCWISFLVIFLKQMTQQVFCFITHFLKFFLFKRIIAMKNLVINFFLIWAVKRKISTQHYVKKNSNAP